MEAARSTSTADHPVTHAGFVAWADGNQKAREVLRPFGWSRMDRNGVPLVQNPSGEFAFTVSTGDAATGIRLATPSTRNPKGAETVRAAESNQQLELGDLLETTRPRGTARSGMRIWLLLVHRAGQQVRLELSLPVAIDAHGHVELWQERIIVEPFDLDSGAPISLPEDEPIVDVTVTRKQG